MTTTQTGSDKEAMAERSGARFASGRKDGETPHSEELKESLVEAGANLRQAATNAVPAAQEQLHRTGDTVTAQAQSLETSLSECIREKPISSVLIAAAIGMFAGLFFLRR